MILMVRTTCQYRDTEDGSILVQKILEEGDIASAPYSYLESSYGQREPGIPVVESPKSNRTKTIAAGPCAFIPNNVKIVENILKILTALHSGGGT